MNESIITTDAEWKEDMMALRQLWDNYKSFHRRSTQSEAALRKYYSELSRLSGKYHMSCEDIAMNRYNV